MPIITGRIARRFLAATLLAATLVGSPAALAAVVEDHVVAADGKPVAGALVTLTRTTYMRDIVFSSDGGVCSTNSNLPAGAVEGQRQSLVCLHPDAVPEDQR